MNKLLKNTLYATIVLLGTSTQFTHCIFPDWFPEFVIILFSDSKPKKNDLIKRHLNRLEEDLIGKPHERIALVIPMRDVNNIRMLGEAQLNHFTYEELQNNDKVDQQLGSVMRQYVINESSKIAGDIITDRETISRTANTIGDSFKTRLQHAHNRNGQALHEFFGDNLRDKVKDSLNNPTYADYYRYAR